MYIVTYSISYLCAFGKLIFRRADISRTFDCDRWWCCEAESVHSDAKVCFRCSCAVAIVMW